MRILMLSDVYFPRVNGVSTSIRTGARELARRGHEVHLVAPDYGAPEQDEGFGIERLPARRIVFDPEDRLIHGAALRAARARLVRQDWDVIHVHTPFQAHRLGRWLRRDLGLRTVETCHTHFEEYVAHYLPWLPASWLRGAARRVSRRLCDAADHLIVPSQQMVEVLRGYGIGTTMTVLPTGLELAQFARGDGKAFRARHGIAPQRPVLVTVSRLAREKNIGFLLEVVATLRPRFPDLLFVIAGEGPDGDALRAQTRALGLEQNVRFFGYLDRERELLDCYRAGDVFVFASPTETQGLVLIEAMALGVPIVSTARLGTAAVLQDAQGARIAPAAVAPFAACVAELLVDPALRARLGHAAREDARRWSAPALLDRAELLYAALAAG
jgi:1,2-diacylglycerol 3-alpha-glucosyltransferase